MTTNESTEQGVRGAIRAIVTSGFSMTADEKVDAILATLSPDDIRREELKTMLRPADWKSNDDVELVQVGHLRELLSIRSQPSREGEK